MTNIEWLRTLSAEELVKFLRENYCHICIYRDNCTENNHSCVEGKVAWLNAEHEEELKPCPCCGGEAVIDDNDMGVYCNDCGMGTTWGATIEDAIKTWNRRVDNE